jgi:hypothetical protein
MAPPQFLSQEALPAVVNLFDVNVNDAAVAAFLVNVTSMPTLIFIPPSPHTAASLAPLIPSGAAPAIAPHSPSCAIFVSANYDCLLAAHDCLDFVRN